MKLTFLGTGAANWLLSDYREGCEFRRNSSALVNGDLLIDPGPHVFHYRDHSGDPELLKNVKNIILTHTHGDHFCPETVEKLALENDCTLWADAAAMRKLIKALGPERASKIRFAETQVRAPLPYLIGSYKIWSLRGNHATDDPLEDTRIYVIAGSDGKGGERYLFYGLDSAWIPTVSWNVIKTLPINAMVMELTCGTQAPNDWRIFEHNTLDMLELMLVTFRKYGYFAPDVKYYTSHMAAVLHTDHASLAKTLEPLGVTPAYDGMEIEI